MFKLPTLFGILLALAGISIVLKQVFHIDLALARIAFGLLLVWAGVAMVARGIPSPMSFADSTLVFSSGNIEVAGQPAVDVIFSSGTVDLTAIESASAPSQLDINTVFGSTTVLYDPSVPLRVRASSAFGHTELPNHEAFAFGDRTWQSPDYAPGRGGMTVKVASVFGSTRFVAGSAEAATIPTSLPAR